MKRILLLTLLLSATSWATAQVCGCTDPLANNYNANATVNDGSCTYNSTTVSPTTLGELSETVNGTSGMIFWNDGYWTLNDHTNTNLYKLDSTSGALLDSLDIATGGNYDTEEVSQDSLYLYFGDMGNNAGSRTNLRIVRISKASLLAHAPVSDTIYFSYSDQTDFTASSQNTDYDCESFVVGADSIFVFTKQWVSEGTVCYGFPKVPGTHVATPRGECNVGGLITGATYLPDKRIVVLCGYSNLLNPFIYLLYDFQGENFFSGNKRKLSFSALQRDQVEAIATSNALDYYITNEYYVYNGIITIPRPAKLQKLDLSPYLSGYLESLNVPAEDTIVPGGDTIVPGDTITPGGDTIPTDGIAWWDGEHLWIYPNPVVDEIHVECPTALSDSEYRIYDLQGKLRAQGHLENGVIRVGDHHLPPAVYLLQVQALGQRAVSRLFVLQRNN